MKTIKHFLAIPFAFFALILIIISCNEQKSYRIENGDLIVEVNNKMDTRIQSKKELSNPLNPAFQNSEFIVVQGQELNDFNLANTSEKVFSDEIGKGTIFTFVGTYKKADVSFEKELTVKSYELFPDMLIFKVKYTNTSQQETDIEKWVNNHYCIDQSEKDNTFWSFQGSSSSERADWIRPVKSGFYQKNYMGMNNSDYGGGIPVTDVWRSDEGIAVGHTSLHPELVSLPVDAKYKKGKVSIGVEKNMEDGFTLNPGDNIETLETFVMLHSGDCFKSLRKFSQYMQAKGIQFPKSQPAAFEPVWCAWGYERNFTVDEIIGTLPKVKELGFKWAVLDDGYQIAEGDWDVNGNKFPGGDAQMKDLVKKIHSYGLKAKLWWAPLAVDPCSNLLTENPDIIVYTDEWAPEFITWWDAYYMSPTYSKTITHTKETLNMFIDDWGFDGLKMDGQHMNSVGPDHNPKHHLDYPEQSYEQLPEFFKMVYETTLSKKPDAVVENCPCGTCMSFYNMPFMNQAVSSDPTSSWQIRLKGKTYKALIPETAYYGDHVELSDGGNDFASSFGVGAVLGTKFTWPEDNPSAEGVYKLTADKEIVWKKWLDLYNDKMLSKGIYRGELYDIGFDKPETHVIQKADTLFYSFYADNWDGEIKLKGLDDTKNYSVYDYIDNINLGDVNGKNPIIKTNFSKHLLIEVFPN